MRFDIHESDVNAVRFFPSGEALGTACSDGTVRLQLGYSLYNPVCRSVGAWYNSGGGRAVDSDIAR